MTEHHWAEASIRRPSHVRMPDFATKNWHSNGHTKLQRDSKLRTDFPFERLARNVPGNIGRSRRNMSLAQNP